MIGSVRKCSTNGDFYIVVKKKDDSNFLTYWLKIGMSCDDIDDINADEEIYTIPSGLIGKIDLRYCLNLCKTAYEAKHEKSAD